MLAERFDELGLPLPEMNDGNDDSGAKPEGQHRPNTSDGDDFECGMAPFVHQFPDIGYRETRVLNLRAPHGDLPPDEYGFLELYCVDPTCDCRRVILQVRPRNDPETVLATINYGWENKDFFTEWVGGDPEEARDYGRGDPGSFESSVGARLDLFGPVRKRRPPG